MAASVALVPLIGVSVFPPADIPQFRITVETPDGASIADTDRALNFVEQELARHPEIKHYFANLGRGNPRVYYNIFPEETNANVAEVFAELHEFDPRRSPQLYEAAAREVRRSTRARGSWWSPTRTDRRSTRRSKSPSRARTSPSCASWRLGRRQ